MGVQEKVEEEQRGKVLEVRAMRAKLGDADNRSRRFIHLFFSSIFPCAQIRRERRTYKYVWCWGDAVVDEQLDRGISPATDMADRTGDGCLAAAELAE